jgi:hypothetical protein
MSDQQPQAPVDSLTAAQLAYQDAVREIEQSFAETYARVDGDYSRATQYAGLVRDEMVNLAKQRRTAALAAAKLTYETAVHSVAGTTPPPAAEQAAATPQPAQEPLPVTPLQGQEG